MNKQSENSAKRVDVNSIEFAEEMISEVVPVMERFLVLSSNFEKAHKEFIKAYEELSALRPFVSVLIKRVDCMVGLHIDKLRIVRDTSKLIKEELKNINCINNYK